MRIRSETFLGSLGLALALAVNLAPAAAAADSAAVLGAWKLSMSFQGQPVDVTLEIKETEGGGLAGTWTGARGADTLADVKWDGTELTFTRTVNRQGQELRVRHSATVNGDTLEGRMILPQREIPFSGKRAS